MQPGDPLVVFSDGISEALNPQGEEFGDLRIVETRTQGPVGDDAQAKLRTWFAGVGEFTVGAPQSDDITALVICYRGTGG